MIIYLFTFLCTLFLSCFVKVAHTGQNDSIDYLENKDYILVKQVVFFLSCLPLIFNAGVRYYVGTDYGIYMIRQFPEVLSGGTERVELLYRWVILAGNALGNIQWVFVLTHMIIIYLTFRSFDKLSKNYIWSVFIFLFSASYNNSLNIMRQFITIAIFIYSIQYILNKNVFKYYISIILSILFHTTGIIYLPIYFLNRIKFSRIFSTIIILASLFISNFLLDVMIWVSTTFDVYTGYFGSEQDFGNTNGTFVAISILLFLISCYLHNKIDESLKKEWNLYNNINLITIVLSINSEIIPNNYRILYMFFIISSLLVPLYFQASISRNKKMLLGLIIIIVFSTMFYRFIVIDNMGETLPYHSIF